MSFRWDHRGGWVPVSVPHKLPETMYRKYAEDIKTDGTPRTIYIDTDWLTVFRLRSRNELIVWWRDE